MTNALVAAPSPAIQEYFRSGNLAQLSDQEKDFVLAKLCERYGLDPLLRPFDQLNLSGKSVFYMNASALNQLAAQKDLSREIVELAIDGQAMVAKCTCRVSSPSGRAETSTAWISLATFRKTDHKAPPFRVLMEGEDFCNALMKVEAKAKRRATMAFFGTPDHDIDAPRSESPVVQVDPTKLRRDQAAVTALPAAPETPAAEAPKRGPGRPPKAAAKASEIPAVADPAPAIAAEYAAPTALATYTKGTPEHTGALRAQAARLLGAGWLNDSAAVAKVQTCANSAVGVVTVLDADGKPHADFLAHCESMLK
jgi:hypothetical protein